MYIVNENSYGHVQSRTIREFDDRFTARQFGYPSYKEYYEDTVIRNKVDDIRIPYLALNAADDMFSPQHGQCSWMHTQ